MFKLMIKTKSGKTAKFVPAPGITIVDVRERYESKWLAVRTANKLNASKQFRKSGIIIVVPV